MPKKKPTPGTILKIPFDDTVHTYARVLRHPFIAVYDCKTSEDVTSLEEIIAKEILFVVAVMDRAVTGGRWKAVGALPLKDGEIPIPDQFMQDMFNPNNCQIIDSSGNVREATIEECEGLERAAVWEAEHVEDRIRDHYLGRPNRWLESMKLIRP